MLINLRTSIFHTGESATDYIDKRERHFQSRGKMEEAQEIKLGAQQSFESGFLRKENTRGKVRTLQRLYPGTGVFLWEYPFDRRARR